ncbi:MAG TPA: MFS transporter [Stellaceae bacterium]|nr:MFS transporter [Stellaceae bacterium]
MSRLAHSRISARLGAYYAAIFLIVGVKTPFWPVFLSGRGLGAHEIAFLFAAAIWVNVVATPAIGALADRLGRRRAVMIVLAGTAIAGYAGLWNAYGFWALLALALTLVAATGQSAIMPLGDSITLAAVRDIGIDYGRVRVWGSVTFILAAIASGVFLARPLGERPAANAVLALVLAASMVLLVACIAVPAAPREKAAPARWAALGALAGNRRFWQFVAATAAIQASHQVYYGFGTLYWRSLGFSDAVIGVLWAEGVVAEILLFWQGRRLLARLGPLGLMMTGATAGIVRWGLMGLVPGLLPAFALQPLHALTFGATHLGAMNFLSRTVPPGAAASAQALYSGASAGIGSGVVMLGAGALYSAYGGGAYLFMAALSAIGLAGVAFFAKSSSQRPHLG